ncbi:MAG: PROBABLE CONSERVED INTEGRAL MEMBRANE ALANINE AND LEUCINE RICH PROTEIN [uncultured Solirubrobacteraceae bacterium]|uniref:PROBABLE CONSERVED INTEGRAL MEMBRANE ALANINE AND LEUCINE RICH PROTEIN n=1 Tax=uncultured Solirubrobacteraceae bacterium TaxID=1162706 RepID=A0A6J4REF0_9ACTN|nr:MAG: PROBABLE CONSERVED INTEGRAL MEMBRANE ALANINE AND LEUCINE RICH PROTEIN [uncultured Solirubrobacteraceae bacterium]
MKLRTASSGVRHNLRMPRTFDTDPSRPPPLAEAVGGPLGMAETSLPAVAFIVAYGVSGSDTDVAAAVAVGLALVLSVARLVKRESPRHALSGLIGVGFAAFIAARSGRAEDFFLPGLLLNAAYAAAFVVSIVVRRPLVGLIVGQLDGSASGWQIDRSRMRAFTKASWMWAGLFVLRLAVQVPLYLAGAVVALGVARTAMGLPLFALAIWLTWLMVRRTPTQAPASAGAAGPGIVP